MFKSRISRRLIGTMLLLTLISLSVLGIYLLQFFHRETLQSKTQELLINAQIIEKAIELPLENSTSSEMLTEKIHQISDATSLRVTLLAPSGTVLADSSEPAAQLDNHLLRPEVQEALNKGSGNAIRYSDTLRENMLYVALPIYQDGQLQGIVRTASPLTPIEIAYDHIRQAILSALFIGCLTAILLGLLLARRQIRPIQQMTVTAKKITGGNLTKRLHVHTGDELEVLAGTINNLTANLAGKIAKLDAENHKLSLILENMDNAVMLLDPQGNIITANKQATALFQLTPKLLHKHSINAIGSTLLSTTAQEVLACGSPKSIVFPITLNGAKKTFTVFFAPLQEGTTRSVLSVFHDISLIQELSTRQADFVANAAHELATPLTSISGFAETLLSTELDDAALNEKFITIIYNEAQRMARLIKDLLQLAKLDSQDYCAQLMIEHLDCRHILTAARAKLEQQSAAKAQSIVLLLPQTPAFTAANADLLLQLIINITENAIKYTPVGGHIQLSCSTNDQHIQIRVKDDGIGIAPSDLPFIFDRFYRTDKARARTSNTNGSGIGLSLAKFIVEMFGGKISVRSQLQQGTELIIDLPQVPAGN